MKKVININFQGRVIPIEESAYELLKKYTESLKTYFANEEGRDEIINDIENRIAELFNEELKKGSPCITDAHVEVVIKSIGRPEDFDQDEETITSSSHSSAQSNSSSTFRAIPRSGVCRNENDKILGGVCSGLAHYLKIDPSIIRILFVLLAFGAFGTGLLIYIILWLVLPSAYLLPNAKKRLFRNPENKVIGGVASGLAAFFNTSVTVFRLIFVLPLIIVVINNVFSHLFVGNIIFGGFGGMFFLAYLILWIVIPEAKTTSEKLEMRGEKVDLESIRKGVKEELNDLKGRAKDMGDEFSAKVKNWGNEVKSMGSDVSQAGSNAISNVTPASKSVGLRLIEVIGGIFKVFFIFIACVIVFALVSALVALVFTGGGPVYELAPFILDGVRNSVLLYTTIVLLLIVPIVGLVIWIIRRMTNRRSGSRYLGWTFGGLWFIGFVCAVFLVANLSRNFRKSSAVDQDVTIAQPSKGRMIVDLTPAEGKFYELSIFDEDDNADFPKLTADEDSMLINTVRVVVTKSLDSQFHVYLSKQSRASSITEAEANASKINFPIHQQDSILLLPTGFAIDKTTQFRNQRVVVYIEVPVGKQIYLSDRTNRYDWFTVKSSNNRRNRGFVIEHNADDFNGFEIMPHTWYTMTNQGPELLDKPEEKKENSDNKDSTPGKTTSIDGTKPEAFVLPHLPEAMDEPKKRKRISLAPVISVLDVIRL